MTIKEIQRLLVSLKADIDDDFRASDDPDDNQPGMPVTVSTTNGINWSYQTGDNSYTGGCYGHQHWSILSLYRNSNTLELARDAVNELRDMVAEAKELAKEGGSR
jgi:hypothetical protein